MSILALSPVSCHPTPKCGTDAPYGIGAFRGGECHRKISLGAVSLPKWKVHVGPVAVWDKWSTKHEAEKAAWAILKQGPRGLSPEFEAGFVQAFVDIADGDSGAVPTIPPKEFWGKKGRTAKGHAKAHEWFEGYASGAMQAKAMGIDAFNSIPVSYPGPGMAYEPGPQGTVGAGNLGDGFGNRLPEGYSP